MRNLLFVLVLAACDPQVVYVYADGGQPFGDGSAQRDTAVDAGHDAALAPDGLCLPNRNPGSISSADCERYPATPVCDAYTSTCTRAPRAFCDPCSTDEQCQSGIDLHSRCVFIPSPSAFPSDQACLSPCTSVSDCAFLGWHGVQCLAVGSAGSFCVVPFADAASTPTCSDFMGGRR